MSQMIRGQKLYKTVQPSQFGRVFFIVLITAIIEVVYYNGQNKKALGLVLLIVRAMNTILNTSFFNR